MYAYNFKRYFTHITFLISSLLYGAVHCAYNQEQILDFHTDIIINTDASLNVTETITVLSAGQQIKRGIVREFPTRYKNRHGNNVVVPFTLKNVFKDGAPVHYALSNKANGKILALGDDSYIKPGKHTYTISYTTNRQLGFYEYDELYWNVTGNGWRLPIAHASARVTLPKSIPTNEIQVNAYTGYQGYAGHRFTAHKEPDGSLYFETTARLSSYEGLTIVAIWPTGFITKPAWYTKLWYFFYDNIYLLWLFIGFIILFAYCIIQWQKVRARNRQETVIPQFYPPENMSAGAVRYIMKKSFDANAFAAQIVQLAVRGFLIIEHEKSGTYTLIKNAAPTLEPLVYEQTILDKLFQKSERVTIKTGQNTAQQALNAFQFYLQRVYADCFAFNTPSFLYFLMIIGFLIILPLFLHYQGEALGALPFIIILPMIITPALFSIYSDHGLKAKAHIDGFKMFLAATETERLKIIGTPPTKTPELYEQYLPYAIALGVEEAWSKQFVPVFERLEQQGHAYVPIWYHGGRFNGLRASSFASSFSHSFNSAISASATPPGSRSGFRGGSSGGGGGGGGGGGR